MDAVTAAIQEVAAEVIEPRFGRLAAGDVSEKTAGELVTTADRQAEEQLTIRLSALLPGVPVVGEEGAADDPHLLDLVGTERRVWLVDPLDGTNNFINGSPDYAVMVALVEDGSAVASWIWLPQTPAMYTAEQGGGAYRDGARLRQEAAPSDPADLRGVAKTRFLDDATRAAVAGNRHRFAAVDAGWSCAGVEYPKLVAGEVDFILYWRTLPWDHAPGVLLLEEAGGHARRPGGRAYLAAEQGPGLLLAADPGTWRRVRDALLSAP